MIKKYNPTSNGMRQKRALIRTELAPVARKPEKSLSQTLTGPVGRSHGQTAVRFRARGAKKHYRVIDFKRDKDGILGKVISIEYDPNRGPNIALISYADGEKRYILAPEGLKVGMRVASGTGVELKVGNSLTLKDIPLGFEIHNIELNPGHGGQLARGAGGKALILAKEAGYANIKLPSGEVKKISVACRATIGVLGNQDLRFINLGKAGKMKHLGRRPHVRGVAMANPAEHPHASSYKDRGRGHPKSPWGWPTRGPKTRKRAHTDKYLVSARKKK